MIDVDRPAKPPESLAAGKSYRGLDVIEALHRVFRGKCYLCESPVTLGAIEVDHRRPQGDERFAHLKYDWHNLFPTCASYKCNQRRIACPDGELLSPGEGVEMRVVQEVTGCPSSCLAIAGTTEFRFSPTDHRDAAAGHTVRELDHIHNDRSNFKAMELRLSIHQHVVALASGMRMYEKLCEDPSADPAVLADQKRWVQQWVSRDAPFTMLVRSYFIHVEAVRALFD